MIELACPTCGKLLKIPMEYRGQTGKCNGCGGPVHVPASALTEAQKTLLQSIATTAPAIVHEDDEEDWRYEPASKKQLSYLADLGATASQMRGLNKGQASELIEELQDAKPITRGAADTADVTALVKAQKAHTNWQKNCCGAVLLVLLSPFWIPACGYIISQADPVNIPQRTPEDNAREQSTTMVYAAQSGRVYHRKDCGRIDGPVESMTIATAEANGMVPCGICQPEL